MKPTLRSLLLALVLAASSAGAAHGVEPVEAFHKALLAKKLYPEALDYLQQVNTNPRSTPDQRQYALYQLGVTALTAAGYASDTQAHASLLELAGSAFDRFISSDPKHSLVGSARTQLGNITFEQGRLALRASPDLSQTFVVTSARNQFKEASEQFAEAEKTLTEQLEEMPKLVAPDQRELQEEKTRLSGDLAQARLMRANIEYETAKTFAADSKESTSHLASAAKQYAALFEAYRTRAVGLLARLWEGRCYQELGQFEQALGCYGELMDLPNSPETRLVRNQSTRYALESWSQEKVKKYQAAIERGERWLKESAADSPVTDAAAIRYLTAVAYHEQSKTLTAKDPNRKKLIVTAREILEPAVRENGEFQKPAQTLLVALSHGKSAEGTPAKTPAPKNFAESFLQAQAALQRMQDAVRDLEAARRKGDQTTAVDIQADRDAAITDAMRLLRQTINLRDKDSPLENLNSARYYLCFLNWTIGNYYDAALLGDFLAKNFADSLPGRQGAKIALAAWVRLYGESKETDRSFEVSQIQRLAELTFKHWPDQPEAEEAALTLVNFAAASGHAEKASEYLARIPADSPRRGQAELRAGQSLWSAYLKNLKLPVEQRLSAEQLQSLRKQAQDLLVKGIERVKTDGGNDAALANAAFSLAQSYFEANEPGKALEWLQEPKFGPLTIVASADNSGARAAFAVETYKMALRLLVAVDPPQLEKAEQAMAALEKLVQGGGDAKAAENLTAIYVSLGRQLQEDLKALRASGKTQDVARMSAAFQVFLGRLLERNAGGSLASLNWVAETYYNLGQELLASEGGQSPQAHSTYEKAAAAYKQLLAVAAKDPKFQASPDMLLGLKLRLAECYRGAGNFDEAIVAVNEVLAEKPTLLTAQMAGAATYQALGATDPTGYEKAILGGSPGKDGKNRIWGWFQLSRVTMGDPKFAAVFHEARLAIVESRYRYALLAKDPQRRQRLLQAALQDVRTTFNVKPDLGGPQTSAKYEQALKQVQKALGQPEVGLQEFTTQPVDNTAASK
jgi:tetratricopeptide (TPR) repeat protein